MKKSNQSAIRSLMYNFMVGAVIAFIFGFSPLMGGLTAMGVSLALAVPALITGQPFTPHGAALDGLLKEVWLSKLMERFYPEWSWLLQSEDMTAFVENNAINLADCGVDPEVLYNNTTYPVPIAERTDSPLRLPLAYFDTKNTVVRNAEAVQLAYNKLESVVRQHRNALMAKCAARAAHAYCPSADSALTPVIQLANTSNSVIDAMIEAQNRLDNLETPAEGRIWVMSPDHKKKLLKEDKDLKKEFANITKGTVPNLYGFDVYTGTQGATYAADTKQKNAFGAAPVAGDLKSSFFYLKTEVMRADGTVDMFSRLRDPEARGDIIGFQKFFLAMPIRNKYIGAVIG